MANGFERYRKKTRRAEFLEEMEQVVPWSKLCALIEPHYPKAGNGRPPVGVERMLRIYFLQQWFNLSDPAVEEALYDSVVMREVCGHRSGAGAGAGRDHGVQVPPSAGRARAGRGDAGDGEPAPGEQGSADHAGTIVDATIIHAPSSTKNREQSATRRCTRRRRGSSGTSG